MKRIFIVNPYSGNGQSKLIIDEITKLLDENKMYYKIFYTNAPHEATKIVSEYNHPHEKNIIYSVGGNGTLFDVVNGIANSNNILGIIPTGTGNAFFKAINNDNSDITYVDLCKMNEYYFINAASIGLDAEIINQENNMKSSHISKLVRYNTNLIKTLPHYQFPYIHTDINDQKYDQHITFLAICNGNYYDNGFKIAPNAKINDRKFDIYLVDQVTKIKIPGLMVKLMMKNLEKAKYVHKLQSNHVLIHADQPLLCNLDGETLQLKDMDFEITPNPIAIYTADDPIKKLCKSKGLYT